MKKDNKYVLFVLSLLVSLVWLAIFTFPDSKFHLVFCDVGQGDAVLITQGFNQILIDAGPNDKVLSCLKNNLPFFDRKIEIIALTHPEADHLTGIIPVMDKYRVNYFLTGPEGNETAVYQELIKKFEILSTKSETNPNFQNSNDQNVLNIEILNLVSFVSNFGFRYSDLVHIVNPYLGDKIKIGEIVLDTWWPEKDWVASKISNIKDQISKINGKEGAVLGLSTINKNLNDFSLVFLLSYKDKKVLLMGDADTRVQDKFIDSITSLPIDILKFPHHGSKTGMGEGFLEAIKPKEAIISVGKNSYGHPTAEALEMLKNAGVKVRRTDLEGEIKYVF